MTRSNVILADIDKKLARKVNININEINWIWEELKLQNETLLNLNGSGKYINKQINKIDLRNLLFWRET